MMTPTTHDPEATRAAILEAAEELVLEKGFSAASMSAIAKRAGVTKSLIHHHFRSKNGLWTEVKMKRFSEYANRQMALLDAQEPTAGLLRESMRAYFNFLRHNPQVVRMLAWVFLDLQEECVEMDKQLLRAGIEKISQGQARGELRSDLNPAFILFTFLGIAHHWFQDKGHMLGPMGLSAMSEAVDLAYLEDAVKIFFEGVLPR